MVCWVLCVIIENFVKGSQELKYNFSVLQVLNFNYFVFNKSNGVRFE